jgi:ribosomal protein L40E
MDDKTIFKLRTAGYYGGTKWLYFYIFIRFPLTFIIGGLSSLANLSKDITDVVAFSDYNLIIIGTILILVYYIPYIFIYIFSIFVYRRMKKLEKSGYKLNMILLISEVFIYAIRVGFSVIEFNLLLGFIIGLIFGGLLWLLPNFIYFKNRKCLFADNITVNKKSISEINTPVVQINNTENRFCRNCGVALSPDYLFCKKCGTKVIK